MIDNMETSNLQIEHITWNNKDFNSKWGYFQHKIDPNRKKLIIYKSIEHNSLKKLYIFV